MCDPVTSSRILWVLFYRDVGLISVTRPLSHVSIPARSGKSSPLAQMWERVGRQSYEHGCLLGGRVPRESTLHLCVQTSNYVPTFFISQFCICLQKGISVTLWIIVMGKTDELDFSSQSNSKLIGRTGRLEEWKEF